MPEGGFPPPASTGIDYFADAPKQEDTPPATLERLTQLAVKMKELERDINERKVALAEVEAEHERIETKFIPDIMTELGLEEFKLKDGSKITVKDDVKCSITEERKPAAWKWLEDTKNDGIIKTAVEATFGRGEMERARVAMDVLTKSGFMAEISRSVHPSTLKAFVKEQLEAGVDIPLETFGVYERKVAKITLPRTRR